MIATETARQCKRCGAAITSNPRRGRPSVHCSRECQRRRYYETTIVLNSATKQCKGCGKEFECQWISGDGGKQRYCSESCRKATHQQGVECICAHCGKMCLRQQKQRFCSRACSDQYRVANPVQVACRVCGKESLNLSYRPKFYCSRQCKDKAWVKTHAFSVHAKERRYWQARSKADKAVEGQVNPFDIFNRDGWICQICRKPVDRTLVFPHPMCAVTDHILPVSKHGSSEARNLQCAHYSCNSKRGNRTPAQGRLFGDV
jgi:hypothetical protein